MRAWRIAALLAAVLAAGCSRSPDLDAQAGKPFDALRKAVRKETTDPARADSLLALTDLLQQRSLELIHAVRAENDTLIRMYADRAVADSSLLQQFRGAEQRRADLRRTLLATRAQLKSAASAAEWDAIAKAETQAMLEVAALTRGK